MSQRKKKLPFEKKETGYHKYAVVELASWVGGKVEEPMYIEGQIAFVPDVVCYKDGKPECIYEVVKTHPVDGYKLGMVQYWCYRNLTELCIHEVDADFVLAQTKKPEKIEFIETYFINPFENITT